MSVHRRNAGYVMMLWRTFAWALLVLWGLATLVHGQALPPQQTCEQKLEAEHLQYLELVKQKAQLEFRAAELEKQFLALKAAADKAAAAKKEPPKP